MVPTLIIQELHSAEHLKKLTLSISQVLPHIRMPKYVLAHAGWTRGRLDGVSAKKQIRLFSQSSAKSSSLYKT